MSEIKRGSSNVYYHDTEFMHVVRFFYNNSGVAAAQNARTRWAFLVVGRDELGDAFLNDKAKSNEDRINEIKDRYLPLLQECVNAKDEPAFTLDKTKISEFRTYPSKFKNKWIIRQSTPSKDANKLKSLLKGFGFFDEASVLKNDENMHSNFGYLRLDVKICNQYLYADNIEDEAYALVALPYIYNKKDDVYDVLVLSEHASVSLMPKVLVEYGVFFDGTKNSMYNVDFNLDFHKYLSEQTKIVLDTDAEKRPIMKKDVHNEKFYPNAATYIREVDEPRKDVIINRIRDEIQENVRYFQNSSKDKINNEDTKYKSWFQDRASDHSDKVYDFLIDIKDGKLNKDTEKAVKDGIILDADTQEYKETLVKEYVYDEILPSGEGSSFVNGYTNIKRLFEHYKAYDPLNLKDSEPRKYIKDSFKVYASGDGCIDPYESGKLKSDSKIGLGLAFGSTGVLAHIVYTCDKIAKNLRHNNYNLVNELVLDVFGFSRGAAEARHFVSSIMKEYDVQTSDTTRKYTLNTSDESKNIFSPFYPEQGGVYTKVEGRYYFNPLRTDIEKITVTKSVGRNKRNVDYYNPYYKKYARKLQIDSVSFRFIGIYDTVAHYGICQANDNKDLNLDFKEAKLGRLVHLTAEDEYRKNFAMTHITESASKKFQEDSKMKEIALPGAHADVGGGYMDKEKSPRYIADENEKLLLKWNKKYEWIKSSPDLFVEAAEDIKEIKRNKKAGFYRIKNLIEDDNLYIYRPKISNKYEYVSLKLMHTEALNSDDNSEKVPFEDISTQYKIDSRNNEFLYKVYKELKEDKFEMHGDLHKELRQGYLHHSADLDGIAPIDVNMPSMDNYTNKKVEIYGKRVKYSSTKKQSCFIS
ncbi:phospholipase effector Tle1 domain-containing protein [Sulfurimonas sp.]|uniref:phospholipase effector Tle1 domain-containing protein n=1 Tax=Sulfurimonas sp. TaxID=2022749 RepID=UPI002B4A562B|nr:DUF2235 domain-containing protein [Sulfurimonas sp.]